MEFPVQDSQNPPDIKGALVKEVISPREALYQAIKRENPKLLDAIEWLNDMIKRKMDPVSESVTVVKDGILEAIGPEYFEQCRPIFTRGGWEITDDEDQRLVIFKPRPTVYRS